jgi:hypothetical protein
MKKTILLLLAGTCFSTATIAQQYEYGPVVSSSKRGLGGSNVRFGVFVAPNSSWMKPTSNKSDDRQYVVSSEGNKIGFTWGLMMDYYFAENYGIATGFQLNTTGGKILAQQNDDVPPLSVPYVKSADFDYRLQYLELPFNLKLRSDELGSGTKLFGQIGLSAGINISKKATYEVTYVETNAAGNETDKTVTGENEKIGGGLSVAPVNLQMNIGGGIEHPISEKMSFYVGLFFNNGFLPDATNPKELKDMGYKGKFTDGNTRLNNFALRIGLFF